MCLNQMGSEMTYFSIRSGSFISLEFYHIHGMASVTSTGWLQCDHRYGLAQAPLAALASPMLLSTPAGVRRFGAEIPTAHGTSRATGRSPAALVQRGATFLFWLGILHASTDIASCTRQVATLTRKAHVCDDPQFVCITLLFVVVLFTNGRNGCEWPANLLSNTQKTAWPTRST